MEYRRGDVRDAAALADAFAGADVVVHLAFMITGTASRPTIRAINVDGTRNAFRAAAEAGAKRFVYASSVAAYGFHPDNPIGMTEDWPVRPARRLFYAREKAEIEHLLAAAAEEHPGLGLYVLRPPIVLGPNALGAKEILPAAVEPVVDAASSLLAKLPLRLPLALPDLPIQFIHERDVGKAFLLCILAAGPPGAYNIAAEDVLSAPQVARELGLIAVPLPGAPAQALARAAASAPLPSFLPPAAEWFEAISRPAIMDTSKARRELGWEPDHTAREAIADSGSFAR